ncbi:MAG: DUF2256 domain-containing protein [Saprospiraceae bacterium]
MKKNNSSKSKKKQHLPSKECLVCKLPFTWRKKWEKNWEEVKYCSDRCRRNKNNGKNS